MKASKIFVMVFLGGLLLHQIATAQQSTPPLSKVSPVYRFPPLETVQAMYAAYSAGKIEELKATLFTSTGWVSHGSSNLPHAGVGQFILNIVGNVLQLEGSQD